jgi:hypothetical protein
MASTARTTASAVSNSTCATSITEFLDSIPPGLTRSSYRGLRKFFRHDVQNAIVEWFQSTSKENQHNFQFTLSSLYKYYKREAREDIKPKELKASSGPLPVPHSNSDYEFVTTQKKCSYLMLDQAIPLVQEWLCDYATEEHRRAFHDLFESLNTGIRLATFPQTTYSAQYFRQYARPRTPLDHIAAIPRRKDAPMERLASPGKSPSSKLKLPSAASPGASVSPVASSSPSSSSLSTLDKLTISSKSISMQAQPGQRRPVLPSPTAETDTFEHAAASRTSAHRHYYWKQNAPTPAEKRVKEMVSKDLLHRPKPYYASPSWLGTQSMLKELHGFDHTIAAYDKLHNHAADHLVPAAVEKQRRLMASTTGMSAPQMIYPTEEDVVHGGRSLHDMVRDLEVVRRDVESRAATADRLDASLTGTLRIHETVQYDAMDHAARPTTTAMTYTRIAPEAAAMGRSRPVSSAMASSESYPSGPYGKLSTSFIGCERISETRPSTSMS